MVSWRNYSSQYRIRTRSDGKTAKDGVKSIAQDILPGLIKRTNTLPMIVGRQFVTMMYVKHTMLIFPLDLGSIDAVP